MFFFSERKALENQYYEWINENGIADQPNSVMAFLDIHGIINHKKARKKAEINKPYPKTNFDKITESVEALSEYIYDHTDCYCDAYGKTCNGESTSAEICKINIIEWLQKECEK